MILFLDIDSRQILDSRQSPFRSLELKRRDTDLIELQFLRDRVVQELPTGTSIRLGIKPSGDFDAAFLASATFTKSGAGTSTKYLADLNLNTTALATAFTTAEEPESLPAMLEIEWASGSNISSSKTLPLTIANDVVRGDEGTPVSAPVFYTSSTTDLRATQSQAEAGTDNNTWMTPQRTRQAISLRGVEQYTLNSTQTPSGIGPGTQLYKEGSFGNPIMLAGVIYEQTGSIPKRLDAALAEKANSTHTHTASDITSGTLAMARIPTGTTGTTVALGDHTHTQLPSPLQIKNAGEATTIHDWGIESEFGPTTLSFEESYLNLGTSEVLNWGNTGELSVGSRRLVNLGAPVNNNDAVRKIDLDNRSSNLSQQVTSITGTSNHNLTANRWHIFTGSPSTGNHTFTLPQIAANGDLVYITFLTSGSTNLEVRRSNYGSTGFVSVSSNLETGKTYLFHYNDFDTVRWRKVTFA